MNKGHWRSNCWNWSSKSGAVLEGGHGGGGSLGGRRDGSWDSIHWLTYIWGSVSNGSALGLEPEPNCGNGSYHMKTRTVAIGPVLPPNTQHFNFTIMAPIKYLSFDRITTWSIRRVCSFSRTFTSHFQICDTTSIRWVAIENPRISLEICPYFTTTQRISVGLQFRMQESNERLRLNNLHIDQVMIRLELKYLIGPKAVGTV